MNQEPQNFEEQSRQAMESTKRLKKRMVVVIICLAIFAVIAIPLISFLDKVENEGNREEIETHKSSTIIFHEADWDLDIMKEAGYISLDRTIYYCDSQYGMTVALDEKNKDDFGPAVIVLTSMIERIIAGDAEGYNQLLSANYFENHDPEPPFTMQQLYDIKLTKIKETETSKGYIQYEFEVEYRIRHNNGTFRTDIGDDESKKQYFVLSDSTSKEVLIDQILNYIHKK